MNLIIDIRSTPYTPVEDVKAEIEEVKKLGDSPEVKDAIARLESYLVGRSE